MTTSRTKRLQHKLAVIRRDVGHKPNEREAEYQMRTMRMLYDFLMFLPLFESMKGSKRGKRP